MLRDSGILDFNPLPRKEGDGIRDIVIPVSIGISIHSLVKRETPKALS